MATMVTGMGCQPGGLTMVPASRPAVPGKAFLPVVDGATLQLRIAEHRGQVVLVDFWATWCPPCRKAFPHTVELAHRYAERGLRVVTVSLDNQEQIPQAASFTADHSGPAEHFVSQHGTGSRSFDEFEIDAGLIPYFKLYDRSVCAAIYLSRALRRRSTSGSRNYSKKQFDRPCPRLPRPCFPHRPPFRSKYGMSAYASRRMRYRRWRESR